MSSPEELDEGRMNPGDSKEWGRFSNKLMEEMELKNKKLQQRFEEVERDRLAAESKNCSITNSSKPQKKETKLLDSSKSDPVKKQYTREWDQDKPYFDEWEPPEPYEPRRNRRSSNYDYKQDEKHRKGNYRNDGKISDRGADKSRNWDHQYKKSTDFSKNRQNSSPKRYESDHKSSYSKDKHYVKKTISKRDEEGFRSNFPEIDCEEAIVNMPKKQNLRGNEGHSGIHIPKWISNVNKEKWTKEVFSTNSDDEKGISSCKNPYFNETKSRQDKSSAAEKHSGKYEKKKNYSSERISSKTEYQEKQKFQNTSNRGLNKPDLEKLPKKKSVPLEDFTDKEGIWADYQQPSLTHQRNPKYMSMTKNKDDKVSDSSDGMWETAEQADIHWNLSDDESPSKKVAASDSIKVHYGPTNRKVSFKNKMVEDGYKREKDDKLPISDSSDGVWGTAEQAEIHWNLSDDEFPSKEAASNDLIKVRCGPAKVTNNKELQDGSKRENSKNSKEAKKKRNYSDDGSWSTVSDDEGCGVSKKKDEEDVLHLTVSSDDEFLSEDNEQDDKRFRMGK